jgi:hypothetical protein
LSDASGFGQVSMPGSPAPGVVHHFHCEAPVFGSRASTNPRVLPTGVSPPIPTITRSRITIGADVDQFDTSSPVSFLVQRSFPVAASSAITVLSGITTKSASPSMATPRLPIALRPRQT